MAKIKCYIDGIERTPINLGAVNITQERFTESGAYAVRSNISEGLKFTKSDYQYIKQQTEIDVCQTISVRLDEVCTTGTNTVYQGIFTQSNCEFFTDSCAVVVQPDINDEYYCLLKNWELDINILRNANIFDLDYQPVFGLEFTTTNCSPNPLEWGGSVLYPTGPYARIVATNFCVGGVPQPPPPSNSPWFLLSDDCATDGTATWGRKAIFGVDVVGISQFTETECDPLLDPSCVPPAPAIPGEWYLMCTYIDAGPPVRRVSEWIDFTNNVPSVTIQNVRFLDNTIAFILNEYGCGLTLRSDLLQAAINPITGLDNPNQFAVLAQRSDVVKAGLSTEVASLGSISLKNLMQDICLLFNARWYIDSSTNEFVFEHVSQVVPSVVGLDLTLLDGGIYAKRKNTVSFDRADLPSEETFANASTNQNRDFIGLPITYSAACTNGQTIEQRCQFIDTELPRIFQNESEGLEGFVLICGTSINNTDAFAESGALSGQFIPNAPFSFANLARDYYSWERVLFDGTLNGVATVFNSVKPTKNQIELILKNCCLSDIDINELVRTEIGDGRIEKLLYSIATKQATIEPKFEN